MVIDCKPLDVQFIIGFGGVTFAVGYGFPVHVMNAFGIGERMYNRTHSSPRH